MQTTKIFLMAALALMTVACSNDDNDIQTPAEQPAKSEGIPFTATISMGESASTRALTEDNVNNKIEATWATGEKVALIYTVGSTPTKTDAEVTKQADGTATISATLASGATNGSDVTIIYPSTAADGTTGNVKANLLAAQDGTLATIATNYDVRKGTGKLSINAGGATVNNGTAGTKVALTNQNAIFKFTLSGQSIDATHPLVIKKGENDVVTTVTPASSTTSVYVAMPHAASSAYRFIVTTDNNKYIKSGTAAITAGKYYQTTLDLTARYPLALSSATVDDLGSVIGADGKIYLNMTAASGASPATTAVAKIVYVGSDNGEATPYNHGLALALSDANGGSTCKWSTTNTNVHTYKPTSSSFESESGLQYNATHNSDDYPAFKAAIANNGTAAPTGCGCSSWFLASGYQWKQMIGATGLNNLGLQGNAYYWSSTVKLKSKENEKDRAWIISTLEGDWGSWGGIAKDDDSGLSRVRACLAF